MCEETIWNVSPLPVSLSEKVVHLWRIELDQSDGLVSRMRQMITADEIEWANRLRFYRDQRRYILAHAALRQIIAGYVHVCPQQILFRSSAYGKPYLAGSQADQLYFNLSHSGEIALLGVACRPQIGVDVETIRPIDDLMSLARNCFSTNEYEQLDALPDSQKLAVFFTIWTRKEAFIKAIGEGLSYPLDLFEVSTHPDEQGRIVHIAGSIQEAQTWTLQAVRPAHGYTGAIAIRETSLSTNYWDWAWEKD